MKIEGAIFDVDGTLLDSMPIWDTLGENYLKSIGRVPKADLKEKIMSMSLQQAAEYFVTEYSVQDPIKKIMEDFNKMICNYYSENVQVKKGVEEFLEKLQKNNVKMCIATANDRLLVKNSLENNKLLGYFDSIFTCNEVGYGKDNMRIFNDALKSLGTKREATLVFEDALFAVKTAKKAGFPVVAVYDECAVDQWEEIKNTADFYINSFLEMEEYFD